MIYLLVTDNFCILISLIYLFEQKLVSQFLWAAYGVTRKSECLDNRNSKCFIELSESFCDQTSLAKTSLLRQCYHQVRKEKLMPGGGGLSYCILGAGGSDVSLKSLPVTKSSAPSLGLLHSKLWNCVPLNHFG